MVHNTDWEDNRWESDRVVGTDRLVDKEVLEEEVVHELVQI